ncbi:MAG: lipid-A-disaccharide synthase [Acidobacteriaceae bacterium]
MKLMLSAGEASGDNYGAMLLRELRKYGSVEAFGLGGEQLLAEGCDLTVNAHEVAAVGITEIVRHLPRLYSSYRKLVRALQQRRPDVLLLIDFPDINFKLARHAHRLGISVVFFVSPQLWAWKPWRLRLVKRYVTRMLVIFPFEEQFYRGREVDAEFVGHPLADLPMPSITREAFASQHKLNPLKPWIALLPGSRKGEVRLNLPEIAHAAALLGDSYEYVLPVASTLCREFVASHVPATLTKVNFVAADQARGALFHARASIVASGTATVEAALMGNPFVVVYRVSPLTYAIGQRLIKVSHYAMANLIAGREIVPELIQSNFTAENVAAQMRQLLPDSAQRNQMIEDLAQVRRQLKRSEGAMDAIAHAAAIIRQLCGSAIRG